MGTQVGVGHLLSNVVNNRSTGSNNGSRGSKWSSSSHVGDRCSNNRGRSSHDGSSAGDNGGLSNNSWGSNFGSYHGSGNIGIVRVRKSVGVGRVGIVGVWEGIVGIRISIEVVVEKSRVSFSFSISIGITTPTSNNSGSTEGSSRKTSRESSFQSTSSLSHAVAGIQSNDGGRQGSSDRDGGSSSNGQRSSSNRQRGSCVGKGSGMDSVRNNGRSFDNRFHNGDVSNSVGCSQDGGTDNRGGEKGRGGEGVEEELGISIGFTLVQTVNSLVAGTREGASVARCVVGTDIVGGIQGVQRVGFRLSSTDSSEGENSDQVLHV